MMVMMMMMMTMVTIMTMMTMMQVMMMMAIVAKLSRPPICRLAGARVENGHITLQITFYDHHDRDDDLHEKYHDQHNHKDDN